MQTSHFSACTDTDCVFACCSQLLKLLPLGKEEEKTMLFENLPLDFGVSTEAEGGTAVSRSLEARSSAGDAPAVASANGAAADGASAGSTALVPSYTFNLGGPPPTASAAVADGGSAAGNHAGSSRAVSSGTTQGVSDAVGGAQAEAPGMEGGHELAASTMLSAFQAVDHEVQQAARGLIPSGQQSHPAGDVFPAVGSDGALAAVAQAEADGAEAAINGAVAPMAPPAPVGAAASTGASTNAAHAAPSGSAATADAAGQAALPVGKDAAASSSSFAWGAAGAAQAHGANQLPAAGPVRMDSTAQGAGSRPASGKAGEPSAEGSDISPESSVHTAEGPDSPSVLGEAKLCSSSQAPPAGKGSQVDLHDALPVVSSSLPPPQALPPAATAEDAAVSDGAGGALQPAAASGLDAARHALQQLQAKGKLAKPKVGKEAFKSTLGLGLHHARVSLVQLQPATLQQVRQGLQERAGLDQLPPCVPMKQPARGQPFHSVPDDEATPAFKVGAANLGLVINRCLGAVVTSKSWHNGLQLGVLFRMARVSHTPHACSALADDA